MSADRDEVAEVIYGELGGLGDTAPPADDVATAERIINALMPLLARREAEARAEVVAPRLTHHECEILRPVLTRYARWQDAHDGPVFEAVEQIVSARVTAALAARSDQGGAL